MAVIKENVYESVAQDTLVRKEKKRSSRSELEIVKTQEKFGTKHQRPCALCEQSFSEVNLVLAVPFKVWLWTHPSFEAQQRGCYLVVQYLRNVQNDTSQDVGKVNIHERCRQLVSRSVCSPRSTCTTSIVISATACLLTRIDILRILKHEA